MEEKIRDWIVTTLLALSVAVLDIYFYVSSYLNDPAQKVAVIGIITFFGLMVSSAYHEYAKEEDRKRTHKGENSGKKGVKHEIEDKEIMRTAIAGTLIVIYIVILSTSIFTNHSLPDKDTVFKTTFDNFGNVIIVVIGFYFGSKGAVQIYRMYKGGKDEQNDSPKKPDAPQSDSSPNPKSDNLQASSIERTGWDPKLQAGELANRLNHDFTVIYANAMDSIEPRGIHKPDYAKKHEAWAKAFRFTQGLRYYVNDLHSEVSLAGKQNSSDFTAVTVVFVKKFRDELNSQEFIDNMRIAEPDIDDLQLHKIWEKAFIFPQLLQGFLNDIEDLLKRLGGSMQFTTFLMQLKVFLNHVDEKLGLNPSTINF